MQVISKIRFLLIVSFLASVLFTTCDAPLGMGDPIDWEPPVLTISPKPPTPMYVKFGAKLTGTVTDNVAVDRVILRDSTNGTLLFTAQLSKGEWRIDLDFSPEQNGETILADVVAFDTAGNSGAESIASVVLIIDITPPVVDDIWVQRTSVRTADLLPYESFKALETDDPRGELSKNVELYQNGAFWIKAKISEEHTNIDSVKLNIYDSEEPDLVLLSLDPSSGSNFSPQWFLTEDEILDEGVKTLPSGAAYKTNYKNGKNVRYYYRVRITAEDKSLNGAEPSATIEDKDYFCLWNEADDPKGILDTRVVGSGTDLIVTKGSTLPVEFYDDDKLEWSYAALFTKEQWAGKDDKNNTVSLASDFNLLGYATDEAKFEAIKTRLTTTNNPVYNWRYDRYYTNATNATSEQIKNLTPTPVDEKIHYIVTGNQDADYGDFVFITMVKDVKQPPHTTSGDAYYPDRIKYRKYNVTLIDENTPLIVFDKSNQYTKFPLGSPEENTFPTIDSNGDFTIHGYTLREDKTLQENGTGGLNSVVKFRLAWIPFELSSKSNTVESDVKKALSKATTPADSDFPPEVQWWEFDMSAFNQLELGESGRKTTYRQQFFSKKFNILGGKDDKKPTQYDNFTRVKDDPNTFENATKLFIFYAEDNMGHGVFTQFYLLGNKTPPTMFIYDFTDLAQLDPVGAANGPPNIYNFGSATGEITPGYKTALDTFNQKAYSILSGAHNNLIPTIKDDWDVPGKDKRLDYVTPSYKTYPRGTTIKLFTRAATNGDLSIENIEMADITNSFTPGHFEKNDSMLGYAEHFPDVTQRVFLFTATDSLGNVQKIQRTVAIANAAALTSITTAEQNGTYPAGKVIEIKANFDGLIKLKNNNAATKPKLNVLYKINNDYNTRQIACEDVDNTNGQLSLIFKFTVPANAQGRLETIYDGLANPQNYRKPIEVDSSNEILDAQRGDSAYTPGNVTGFNWTNAAHSLQYDSTNNPNGKNINLDGIAPVITAFSITQGTKAPYMAQSLPSVPKNLYYLKSGESLSVALTASKPLKISGNTSLQFNLLKPSQDGGGNTANNSTAFEYRKVSGYTITYTLDVNSANIGNVNHGQLSNISLFNAGNITDDAGNPLTVSTFNSYLTAFNNNNEIYFDLKAPPKPGTSLTVGGSVTNIGVNPSTTLYYSSSPYMGMTTIPSSDEPYGAETRQYSLNGGLKWVDFPTAESGWTTATAAPLPTGNLNILNGQWNIKTRYIDKAGNEGATTDQLVYINNKFPSLIGVRAVQPSATYTAGQQLQFTLDFDDVVSASATDLSNVEIVLKDTTTTANTPGGTANPTYERTLRPTSAITNNSTVTFSWTLAANTNDMLNGLALKSVRIDGLKDKFGNSGPVTAGISTSALSNSSITIIDGTAVSYDLSGIKVSTITPTVRSREPQNANNRDGNINNYSTVTNDQAELVTSTTVANGSISVDNKIIKLNFSKPMQKGNGTITIKPRAPYAIPAVFEHEGYYVTYTYDSSGNITAETTSSSQTANSTYVSGFADIFNSSSINDTDRNTLIGSSSMSAPALSNVTGLSTGPYLKTTQGLKQGAGYTGNYGNATTPTDALPGINAPGPRGSDRMVPDVATKWVLAYSYDNLFATTGVVNNIRAVLDKAKWRWREIPVSDSSVTINNTTDNKGTVTITLSEPLLPGLQWDVSYSAGTFTDTSGNSAAAGGTYWFWSRGVQKPVIRVDRKSYDARASADYNKSTYNNNFRYNATGYNGGIDSFTTIQYRITSETPQARIFHGTRNGRDAAQSGVRIGSITGKWTGQVSTTTMANISISVNSVNITWQGPKTSNTQTTGNWVQPNLIFRHGQNGSYQTMMQPSVNQTIGGLPDSGDNSGAYIETVADGGRRYYGFRSYNYDATITDLNNITLTTTVPGPGVVADSFSGYDSLEASKNYVAAVARIDHKSTNLDGTKSYSTADYSSQRGFEGVFRTVIMMNQTGLRANGSNTTGSGTGSNGSATNITTSALPMMIAGTNVRSGLPTISGFPLKDGTHGSDSRYVKFFYRIEETNGANGTDGKQFYWVTTEMVSQWYIQIVGKGNGTGSSSTMGDVEDWISAGYGDLTYALNLATW